MRSTENHRLRESLCCILNASAVAVPKLARSAGAVEKAGIPIPSESGSTTDGTLFLSNAPWNRDIVPSSRGCAESHVSCLIRRLQERLSKPSFAYVHLRWWAAYSSRCELPGIVTGVSARSACFRDLDHLSPLCCGHHEVARSSSDELCWRTCMF